MIRGIKKSQLHRIISESIKSVLNEQKFSVDPTDIAEQLFNNGDDFNLFVHWLEKTYDTLQSDRNSNPTNDEMELVQAIKKSRTFTDTTGGFEGEESGDARLRRPVKINGVPYIFVGYGIENAKIYFYGYKDMENGSDIIDINQNQMQEIIQNLI